MEHSFGTDFSSVRVHEGAQSQSLGAIAFASGEDIHFQPGAYDPGSAHGHELIGHELAHVVQQREGRVATPQGKDADDAINNDPALEREADDLGARAARGEVVAAASTAAAAAPGRAQRKVIQRKVGFEFETTDWTFRGKMNNQHEMQPIAHTKRILLDSADGLGGAGADNGHIEFLTEPLTSVAQVRTAIAGLRALSDQIRDRTVAAEALATAAQRAARDEVEVTAGAALQARPQATIGVRMEDIPQLFEALQMLEAEQAQEPDTEQPLTEHVRGAADDVTSVPILMRGEITANLGDSLAEAGELYEAAVARATAAAVAVPNHDNAGVHTEVVGFLALALKTLWDAYRNAGPGLDDAKYAFTLMARTDFRSMVTSMSAEAQACLGALWGDGNAGALAHELNARYPLDTRVFSKRNAGDHEVGGFVRAHQRQLGPTKRGWLDSAIAGRGLRPQNKDQMSPPAPYPAHQGNAHDEGLGAKGVDADNEPLPLSLLEMRGLAEGARVPAAQWENLAVTVYRLVELVRAPAPAAHDAADADEVDGGPDDAVAPADVLAAPAALDDAAQAPAPQLAHPPPAQPLVAQLVAALPAMPVLPVHVAPAPVGPPAYDDPDLNNKRKALRGPKDE